MQRRDEIHRKLDEFRTEYADIERGAHERVTAFLSRTVTYVHKLSPQERLLILEHPFFADRKYKPNVEKTLFHYFCCIMDAQSNLVYKQASSYARALAHLYEEAELNEDLVRDEIEQHGGVEGLRRHVQAVETNAKVGLGVLHLEGNERQLASLLEGGASEMTIIARREADGKGGWKRYLIESIEDTSF